MGSGCWRSTKTPRSAEVDQEQLLAPGGVGDRGLLDEGDADTTEDRLGRDTLRRSDRGDSVHREEDQACTRPNGLSIIRAIHDRSRPQGRRAPARRARTASSTSATNGPVHRARPRSGRSPAPPPAPAKAAPPPPPAARPPTRAPCPRSSTTPSRRRPLRRRPAAKPRPGPEYTDDLPSIAPEHVREPVELPKWASRPAGAGDAGVDPARAPGGGGTAAGVRRPGARSSACGPRRRSSPRWCRPRRSRGRPSPSPGRALGTDAEKVVVRFGDRRGAVTSATDDAARGHGARRPRADAARRCPGRGGGGRHGVERALHDPRPLPPGDGRRAGGGAPRRRGRDHRLQPRRRGGGGAHRRLPRHRRAGGTGAGSGSRCRRCRSSTARAWWWR